MCPPPCGPRRCSRIYCAPLTHIDKIDVEKIIEEKNFICDVRQYDIPIPCDESSDQLIEILNERSTSVRIAATNKKYFRKGYRTVVMEAPQLSKVFLIRLKRAERKA